MKTVIFDTESNHYWPWQNGILSIEDRRSWVRGQEIIFDCAAILCMDTGRVDELAEPHEVVTFLQRADRLVSYNGKRVDLPILENKCGKDAVAPLWAKPHCDLLQVCDRASLEDVSRRLAYDVFTATEHERLVRVRAAAKLWPDVKGFPPPPQRFENKISQAVCDVKRTEAVFRAVSVEDWHWQFTD